MIYGRFDHAVRLGLRSLLTHRLRSMLTTLGIILGVGSVIVMLSIGEAARYQALKQLEDLGANTILLRSVKPIEESTTKQGVDQLAYGITYLDLERLRQTIPSIQSVTPIREYRKTVRYRDQKLESRIMGVTPEFMNQFNMKLALGRNIDELDEKNYANVAILGSAAAEALFPTSDPLGRSISIECADRPRSFTVIGVTQPKTLSSGDVGNETDFTRVVFIPFASDRVRIGRELITSKAGSFQIERLEISQLTVTVDSLDQVGKTAEVLKSLVEQFHPRKDVTISIPLDLLEKAEKTQQLFTIILSAIASISLLVGGIGIMNIMLATVTERTREIGIRRALGAKQRDIAMQFLAETLVLTCFGGIIGVALGIGLSYLVAHFLELPTIIRIWSPLVAFGVSLLVGLISGGYPARRAASLDPIEALRHV